VGRIGDPSGSLLRRFAVLILDPCGDAASPLRPTRAGSADRAHRGKRRTIGIGRREIARASVGNVHDPMTIAPPNQLTGPRRTISVGDQTPRSVPLDGEPGDTPLRGLPTGGVNSGPARRRAGGVTSR